MTLYSEGSDGFVASAAASIATRVERTSSRAGVIPAGVQSLFTAHCYADRAVVLGSEGDTPLFRQHEVVLFLANYAESRAESSILAEKCLDCAHSLGCNPS
jgi:hypothetical protein